MLAAGEFMAITISSSINEFRYDAQSSVIYQMYRRLYFVIYSTNLVINNFGMASPVKTVLFLKQEEPAWCHMMAAVA